MRHKSSSHNLVDLPHPPRLCGEIGAYMENTDLAKQLQELFRETGKAHHQAFSETDGADPDWPIWYAEYACSRLGKLLNAKFTKSELVYLIVAADKEQSLRAPGADWPVYFTKFFLERYRP
jgi:hypothetical protein